MAAGVAASPAVAVALAGGALGVLSGGAVLLAAIFWRTALSLMPAKAAAAGSSLVRA
jgi:hypothetical protein